jgi:hypothetical protein
MELRTLLDWFIKPQLRTVPGVSEVNSFYGEEKQYQVLADPNRLVSFGRVCQTSSKFRKTRTPVAYIEYGGSNSSQARQPIQDERYREPGRPSPGTPICTEYRGGGPGPARRCHPRWRRDRHGDGDDARGETAGRSPTSRCQTQGDFRRPPEVSVKPYYNRVSLSTGPSEPPR